MLELFASERHPLRASSIPLLIKCPWRAVLLYLKEFEDTSSAAADTGSAVHAAIEAWHGNGQDVEAAIAAMREKEGNYPLADFGDAELHFRPYTRDPRNINADLVLQETPVRFDF